MIGDNIKRNAWNLGVIYDLAGANYVWAGYTQAGDEKGSAGVANSGGKEWQLGFGHQLSKRTEARIGYARVSNDQNGEYVVGGIDATGMRTGSSSSVVALQLFHKF